MAETVHEEAQTLDLVDKYFKIAFLICSKS